MIDEPIEQRDPYRTPYDESLEPQALRRDLNKFKRTLAHHEKVHDHNVKTMSRQWRWVRVGIVVIVALLALHFVAWVLTW